MLTVYCFAMMITIYLHSTVINALYYKYEPHNTSSLCLGSQDVAGDLNLLKSHGITHILNLAQIVENKYEGRFTYMKLDLLDLPETRITDHFAECFKFIDSGRESGSVFVHCNAGVSRAATVVIAYYMRTEKTDLSMAYEHVKSVRNCIRPNDGFMAQLKQYKHLLLK